MNGDRARKRKAAMLANPLYRELCLRLLRVESVEEADRVMAEGRQVAEWYGWDIHVLENFYRVLRNAQAQDSPDVPLW
jgi:hypothetical protein